MSIHTLSAGKADQGNLVVLSGIGVAKTVIESPPAHSRRLLGGIESSYAGVLPVVTFFNPKTFGITVALRLVTPVGTWVLFSDVVSAEDQHFAPNIAFFLQEDEHFEAVITAAEDVDPSINVFPQFVDLPSYVLGRERVELGTSPVDIVPEPTLGRMHVPVNGVEGESFPAVWLASGPAGLDATVSLVDPDLGVLTIVKAALGPDTIEPKIMPPIVKPGQKIQAVADSGSGFAFVPYLISQIP